MPYPANSVLTLRGMEEEFNKRVQEALDQGYTMHSSGMVTAPGTGHSGSHTYFVYWAVLIRVS